MPSSSLAGLGRSDLGESRWLCTHRALAYAYKFLVLRLVQQGLGHGGFRRSHFFDTFFMDYAVFYMVMQYGETPSRMCSS